MKRVRLIHRAKTAISLILSLTLLLSMPPVFASLAVEIKEPEKYEAESQEDLTEPLAEAQRMNGRSLIKPSYEVQISAGGYHSLALKSDGTVWTWGNNAAGQLGNGTTEHSTTPVQVSELCDTTAVSAGLYHSLALKSDGTVWAWGNNANGQLGDGTTGHSTVPVKVNITDVIAISAGSYHSLALKNDGTVWAWGDNSQGQLGDNTTIQRAVPVQANITSVKAISAGGYHSLALRTNGATAAWGDNRCGQLGINITAANRLIPTPITGVSDISEISAGFEHSMALNAGSAEVYTWGSDNNEQLGHGHQIQETGNITKISAGYYHSTILADNGTVWAWGDNSQGQLGSSKSESNEIAHIKNMNDVIATSAGLYHNIALKSDGTVWTWGNNSYGQLGNGMTEQSATPVQADICLYVKTASDDTVLTTFQIQENREYIIALHITNATDISSKVFTFEYEPETLTLLDFAVHAKSTAISAGTVAGTNITILSIENGRVTFRIYSDTPPEYVWSGVITTVKFRAVTSGTAELLLSY